MKINEAGLKLIKEFEGCRLQAYRDIVGILTIGFGHTGVDVVEGKKISQEEADKLLSNDLIKFENGVCKLLKHGVNDNQFSALVCFAYNVGLGNLASSTLLKKLNAGDLNAATSEFLRWCKAGGVQVPGLLRRRKAEQALFQTPIS